MSEAITTRLTRLGLELPAPAKPVANFVPCVQSGSLLFVSGQISSWNGEIRYAGKVGRDLSREEGIAAARLCALNLLAQVKSHLGELERVARVTMVQVFVNAIPEFTEHPAVANGASDLIVSVLGETVGRHARFAVGAGSLPFNAAVEVAATLEVR
ncbi:MAG TPA: RidA family protein [Gemmatimonadales bacterium]|nr:RidA family protein [Gemmatimonadales bacterium]